MAEAAESCITWWHDKHILEKRELKGEDEEKIGSCTTFFLFFLLLLLLVRPRPPSPSPIRFVNLYGDRHGSFAGDS